MEKSNKAATFCLSLTMALIIWYLVQYSIVYEQAKCMSNINNNEACQMQAAYIILLVLFLIVNASMLGLFNSKMGGKRR